MAEGFNCYVKSAGPSTLHSDTPVPEIVLCLSDYNGSFSNAYFFAAQPAKNQMLAVALAAVSTQSLVSAWVDPPNSSGGPWTQCYELRILGA